MWELMAPFAQMHLSVLWEISVGVMTNPATGIGFKKTQVEAILKQAAKIGAEYVHLLDNAWKVFHPYRMTLIWDKPAYGWHPFDFLHANTNQGSDKLNIDPPVNVKSHAGEQNKQVKAWAYKGCSDSYCNLFQHITTKAKGGCGCPAGRRLTKNKRRLSRKTSACWTKCMKKYKVDQENKLKAGFLDVVTDMKKFLIKLEFPPTLKVELQAEGTQCEKQDTLTKAKCAEGFKLLRHPIAGSAVEVKNDANIPGGCSFHIKDGKAVYNEAQKPSSAFGYQPLCAALFFSSNKGTPRAPMASKRATTQLVDAR